MGRLKKLCGKKINRGLMTESRGCLLSANHKGSHSPDLTGMRFGRLVVERLYTGDRRKHKGFLWVVSQAGFEKTCAAIDLLRGNSAGYHFNMKPKMDIRIPEYNTVVNHWNHIFNKLDRQYRYYRGMPFFKEWDPTNGGAYRKGASWIIENLGHRPDKNWSLDIVNHSIGFVPGNLRWAKKKLQKANQRHRILGQISEEEFAVEAKRRGYVRV